MRLSVATKVFLGFVAVLICSAAVSAYGVARLHRIGEGLSLLSRPYMPLARAVSTLDAFHKLRVRNTDNLLDATDPKARSSFIASDRTYMARSVGESLASAQQLVAGAQQTAADAVTARLEKTPRGPDAALEDAITRLRAVQRVVDYKVKDLGLNLQDQMNRGVDEAEKQERAARWALVALSGIALLVGLLVMWLSQRALRPIRTLTEAAQRLGRGSPESVAVPEEGGDELAVLAREFNAMAQRLAARERELRAQGEALLRSERLAAIGRVAAQITHEIRNPLSSISLNAEELGERAPQARELCDAIVREVDRLTAITEEYLRFARLPKPQLQRADVNDTVRELLEFVRPELDSAGVKDSLSLSPGLPRVLADVAQLRQLLLNLLSNAREAMSAGGSLRVTTRATKAMVEIEVRDSGPGIPSERLARIFDPFFTTKERGTGLGLAMAQEIAQEHGGQLLCESVAGEGTVFTLRLPAAPLLEQAQAQAIATA